jgi:tetratricopeptide (TPR) repeat protein
LLYANPEQLVGVPGAVDDRSEVFSLGICLYEALTLERPFRGDTDAQILQKITSSDPEDPRALHSKVPYELAAIVMKMLEVRPLQRYQTMRELSEDLDAFLLGGSVQASMPGKILQTWRWLRRRPFVLATLSLSVALFVALAFSNYLLSQISSNMIEERRQAQVFEDLRLDLLSTADFFDEVVSSDRACLSPQAMTLHEFCLTGSDALVPMRAHGYDMLIGAHLSRFDHLAAEYLLEEAVGLGLGGALSHSPVLYEARIYAMRWQDTLASKRFDQALRASLAAASDSKEEADLGEVQLILTELIMTAVNTRDEARLLDIRLSFGDPEELLQERYDSLRETFSVAHPLVCDVRFAQGLLLTFFRDHSGAVEHWESLLMDLATSRLFDERHPLRLRVQHELAYALVYVGETERAVKLFDEAVERWDRRGEVAGFRKPYQDSLVPRWRQAWAYLEWFDAAVTEDRWKAERSEKAFRAVIKDMGSVLGEDAVKTLQAKTGFSVLLNRVGKLEEAISMMEQTYEQKFNSEALGPRNISTLISLRALYQLERELMLREREAGDLVAAKKAAVSFCEHTLLALEGQMDRVPFLRLPDLEAGLSDYEECIEFTGFSDCLSDCPEELAGSFDPQRIRRIAQSLLGLVPPNPYLGEVLGDVRQETAAYLRAYDRSPEAEQLVSALLK